jgi:DNA-binding YbaB/EbfC family protein
MGPFKQLGQIASLLGSLPKLKEEMERFQQKLPTITAEGDAGAGMVKAKVNGKMEVLAVQLSEDAIKQGDREMLEDLIRAAVNQALERVRAAVAEETSKLASGMGLPPISGLGLPGLP